MALLLNTSPKVVTSGSLMRISGIMVTDCAILIMKYYHAWLHWHYQPYIHGNNYLNDFHSLFI